MQYLTFVKHSIKFDDNDLIYLLQYLIFRAFIYLNIMFYFYFIKKQLNKFRNVIANVFRFIFEQRQQTRLFEQQ